MPGLQKWYAHVPNLLFPDRLEGQYRRFSFRFLHFPVDNFWLSLNFGLLDDRWPTALPHPDPIAMQIADDGVARLLDHGGNLGRGLPFGAQLLGDLALLFSPFHFSIIHFSPSICSNSLSRSSLLVSGRTSVVITSMARLKKF